MPLFRCVRFILSISLYVSVFVVERLYLYLHMYTVCMQRMRAYEHWLLCGMLKCVRAYGLCMYVENGHVCVWMFIHLENATSTSTTLDRNVKEYISESRALVAMHCIEHVCVCFHLLFGGKHHQMSPLKIPLNFPRIEKKPKCKYHHHHTQIQPNWKQFIRTTGKLSHTK